MIFFRKIHRINKKSSIDCLRDQNLSRSTSPQTAEDNRRRVNFTLNLLLFISTLFRSSVLFLVCLGVKSTPRISLRTLTETEERLFKISIALIVLRDLRCLVLKLKTNVYHSDRLETAIRKSNLTQSPKRPFTGMEAYNIHNMLRLFVKLLFKL